MNWLRRAINWLLCKEVLEPVLDLYEFFGCELVSAEDPAEACELYCEHSGYTMPELIRELEGWGIGCVVVKPTRIIAINQGAGWRWLTARQWANLNGKGWVAADTESTGVKAAEAWYQRRW